MSTKELTFYSDKYDDEATFKLLRIGSLILLLVLI